MLEIGLAEVFITRMSRIESVRVLPLSATLRVQREDPLSAGRQLGADYVLTGSLQRDAGRLRADVKLLSVRANNVVWQDTFDDDDRVSVQDAIAGRVIEAIAPHVSGGVRRRIASPGTADREAYEAYLNGRAHVSRPNRSDLNKAVDYFRTAVGRDQGFADAWAGLALALRMLPIAGDERPIDTIPAAKAAADRALALEPDHPEALAAHGMIAFYFDWDFETAERLVRRALDLEPSALAHLGLAHILSNIGRHEEALAQVKRARALDPAWPLARALEGQFLFLARRYDKALAHLDGLAQYDPNFPTLIRLYPLLAQGRYQAALEACERVEALLARSDNTMPGQPFSFAMALRGYALAKLGKRAPAERVLQQLHAFGRDRYIPPYHLALVLHALGRNDEALERLREAVDARDWFVIFLGTDPKWDELRSTPAFDALLSRANLLEVSRAIKPEQMSRSAASAR